MAYYQYVKALHLIFVITWFAGLFYVPRLFMYHIEATQKDSPEKEILSRQLKLMTKRLWFIITWPSMILASIFAFWLFYINPALIYAPWMQIKLGFVFLLYIYHFKNHQIFKQLQGDSIIYSTSFMRIWNEVATLILFAVVFLAVLKDARNWVYGIVGLVLLAVLLMLGIKLYKRIRDKNPNA